VQYAELLAAHLPAPLESVYFVNSGSEANEGAIKLAKRYTGRPNVVAFHNAYHGSTQGVLSVIGSEEFRSAYRPLVPGVRHVPFNNTEALEAIDTSTACVIAETVQAEAGIKPPSQDFVTKLQERCTETGTLLILDEVQAGMGRTGKCFGFEHYEVVPDIVTLAKAFGGGLPLGAFISSRHIMQALTNNPLLGHITTFGGNAVSCAAGMAAFRFIMENKLYEEVEPKARLFKQRLQHPAIKAVRNKGLLMAIEFESFDHNKAIIDKAISKGVLTDWFLFADNCLRIAPPLTIETATIHKACDKILESIEETMAHY
jgi:acetylornithine/succinyldiaminopimelate/putrescine aminotransferase